MQIIPRSNNSCVYPVDLEYLKALSDVGRVHWQSTSSGNEPHEQDTLVVAERVENFPEPLNEVVGFIDLAVPTVNNRLPQLLVDSCLVVLLLLPGGAVAQRV